MNTSRLKIVVTGLISKEHFFRKLPVCRFKFIYYSNIKEVNKELKMSLSKIIKKCYAIPHEGYMYFLGNEKPLFKVISKLADDNLVKDYSEDVEETTLEPTISQTHNYITKRLFYIGLKAQYGGNIKKAPFLDKKGEVILYPPQEPIDLAQNISCYIGLRIKLEISRQGYGILWYDMTATACLDRSKRLSYADLRKFGLLDEFREIAVPNPPIKRFETTEEYFSKIFGNTDNLTISIRDWGMCNFLKINL